MHGANVVSLYEPSRVTHLVTAGVEYEKVATVKQNIGRDIYKIPLRIKIVHWKWVSDCELAGKVVEPTKKQYIFQERWEPGQESNKGRRLAVAEASQDPVVDKKRQSAERFLNYSDDEEEESVFAFGTHHDVSLMIDLATKQSHLRPTTRSHESVGVSSLSIHQMHLQLHQKIHSPNFTT